jgi:hypothetical protein
MPHPAALETLSTLDNRQGRSMAVLRRRGRRMELSEKKINELLDAIMLKARENRMQIPYSREDGFPQCVLFLGPNFEPAVQPVTWRDEDEKYHMMRGVSEVAKEMLCRANAGTRPSW